MRKGEEVSQFAIELNRLCEARWPGGDRYANALMAEWVSEKTHVERDRQYIWRIRKGRVNKVDADVRDALCSFFGVPTDHFSQASQRTMGQEVGAVLEQTGLQVAGLRADELSEAGRNDLARLLQEIGQIFESEKGSQA